MISRISAAAALALSIVSLCGVAQGMVRADDSASISKLVETRGPALVTVKFILKGGEQDEESETTGVVIDPSGLILTSNNAFDGVMARFGQPARTPSDIKVLIGEDTQGLEAKFYARDSELGLAWVQLKDAPAKPLAAVDFEKGGTCKLGDGVYTVALMGKFFDRAHAVCEGRVSAVTKKPRELYIPSVGLAGFEPGLPAFNGAGQVVGFTTLILPDQEEVQGTAGGMRAAMRGIIAGCMILPSNEVVAATKRAKETAASGAAEAPKADAPKEEAPKADAPKADAPGKTAPEQPK